MRMRRKRRRQRSFADLELEAQGVSLEPVLQSVGRFLDQHAEVLDAVHRDLVRGLKNTKTGRVGLSAEQVLRSVLLQRIKDWDYRELRERIADGYTLRCFTGFGSSPVPKHQAFHRSFCRLQPQTMRRLNEAVVAVAVELGIENARWLRADTTVVETNIHFPTDSALLWDTVRVLTRLATEVLEQLPQLPERLANRTRCARRRMQELQRMTPTQRHAHQKPVYKALLKVSAHVITDARRVAKAATAALTGLNALDALRVEATCKQIAQYAALGSRVIDQAHRRVVNGEKVPADEKLYSLFEPHTDMIKRGKANKPVEFGHKIFLAESRRGLVTDYWIIDGNPNDDVHVKSCVDRHRHRFGMIPDVYAVDRGFYSPANVALVTAAGVKTESIPQRGGKKSPERAAHEKSRRFKHAQKFRAGIEGRISVLFRGRGMKRCPWHGSVRFEVFVAGAVLANNLLVIAAALRPPQRQRHAA
jgi:IS5 family transposase